MWRSLLLCSVVIFPLAPLQAQSVDQLREATVAIDDFLDVVCIQRDDTTTSSRAEAEARLEIGLTGLFRKLVNIEAIGGGSLEKVEEGVTREDLGALLKQEGECREDMTKWVWENLEFSEDVKSKLDPFEAFKRTRLANGFRAIPAGFGDDSINLYLSLSGVRFFLDMDAQEPLRVAKQNSAGFILAANWINDTEFTFGGCDIAFRDAQDADEGHANFFASFLTRTLMRYDLSRDVWVDDVSRLGPTGSEMDLIGSLEFFSLADASVIKEEVMGILSCRFAVLPDGTRADARFEKVVLTNIYDAELLYEAAALVVESREILNAELFERIGGHTSPYLTNRIDIGPGDIVFDDL